MTIRLRPARDDDAARIFALHDDAFPTGAEARLAAAMAADGDVLLSLVAETDGAELAGHVLFSRAMVEAGARALRAAVLAPLAIDAGWRGAGIGSALVDAGLAGLEETGIDLVFVLGDPDFFDRFGFDAKVAARFDSPCAGPFWQALALGEAPLPKRATVRRAPAFGALADAA